MDSVPYSSEDYCEYALYKAIFLLWISWRKVTCSLPDPSDIWEEYMITETELMCNEVSTFESYIFIILLILYLISLLFILLRMLFI